LLEVNNMQYDYWFGRQPLKIGKVICFKGKNKTRKTLNIDIYLKIDTHIVFFIFEPYFEININII